MYLRMDSRTLGTCILFMVFSFTLGYNDTLLNNKYPTALITSIPNTKQFYNLLSSPLSVRSALLAFGFAAKGKTQTDIEKLLYGGKYPNAFKNWHNTSGVCLFRIENKVYLNKNMDVTPCVKKRIKHITEYIDYSNAIDSANHINKFVQSITNETYTQIVLPKFHNKTTYLTYVNVKYLKLKWQHQFINIFPKDDNSTGVKFLSETLHQDNEFLYGDLKDLSVVAVEIPLRMGGRMVVLQPKRYHPNFQNLKKTLQKIDIRKISSRLKKTEISLYFPLLELLKMDRSMVPTMANLNITKPFREDADFRNLHSCGEETYIKMFNQRSRITTLRKGIFVRSATALQWAFPDRTNTIISDDDDYEENEELRPKAEYRKKIIQQPKKNLTKVILTRPFFYAIILNDTTHWMGTVYKPDNWDRDIQENSSNDFL